jgi:hypothetical protein
VCDQDPGFPVAVTVTSSLRSLVQVWLGDLGWPTALRSGAVVVDVPRWFTPSPFASVPRPA